MQVKVRAVIWHHDCVVVARESRHGAPHLSLPGGRPERGERLLDALTREVLEETGLHVRVGRLLYVAECVNDSGLQDLNLVFAAAAVDPVDAQAVCLVDPTNPREVRVLPPILDAIAADAPGPPAARVLGNVWEPSTAPLY